MKNKKLLSVIFAFTIVAAAIFLPLTKANAASESDLTFKLNSDGTSYCVSDCSRDASGALVIPSTYNGLPVTAIRDSAFKYCNSLTSVTIPDSVESIGYGAFSDCTSLTSITIPDSVQSIGISAFWYCTSLESVTIGNSVQTIGNFAFSDCTSLTSVTIGNSVQTIGKDAFYSCDSLTSITIPDSVKSIGWGAFGGCKNLTGIWVAESNSTYSSDSNGVLYNKNKTELVAVPGNKTGSFEIPDSVTAIGNFAFEDCDSLTSVTIPDSVQTIGDYAFLHCDSLESVTIGNSVESIGDSAFSSCDSLTSITIPDSVQTIGSYAFLHCDSLTDVYYGGTKEQWEGISIGSENDDLLDANIHFKGAAIDPLTAPKISVSGETISWAAVANADSYEVYRATSKSGKYTKVTTVAETSWADNVTPGKTYYYKVKAIYTADSSKNSDFSNCVSIDYKLASPVISVENNDSGKPCITWEKVSGAKKYTVYVATSQNGTYKKLGTSTKTYYTDTKAKAGTTYFYKVVANASSSKYSSGYSNTVSCGVICGTPAVTVTVDTTTGKPSLSWKKVDGAAKYAIYRKLPTDTQFVLQATQTAVSYKDTTAPVDTKCEYYVQALGKTEDLNGTVSKVVTATSGIAKPTVTGSLNNLGQPKLSWKQVEGAVKYEVYRSTKSSKGYVLLKTVEGLSYEDASATIGKTYYYKVKAVGAVSKSADSSYVKLAGKCTAPVISVENNDSGKPYITWEKVSGAKKYTIYRATAEAGKYTKLGTTTKLTYTDTTAKAGNTYFYKVVANASSSKYDSGYSNIVSATHRLTSSSTAKDTGSDAIWEDPTANSRDYYEETDPNRTSYLEYIARYNNTLFFYLQEDSMRMYLGKTYGMPLIASQETMLACTWFSSDPSVATVNNMGFVTPLKLGNTVISVRYISPETGEEIIRNCDVRIENKPVYTVAQLEAAAKEEAKKIANYAMYEAGCTTDLERIAVAAALINAYVAEGKGGTYYAIENGQLVEKKIAGYNQPYGTLVTFHSTCAGDVRALGMVLEYMGFQWYHVNADKNTHQWCVVYNVDGQTAFADGAQYGVVGYGERAEDRSNWMIYRNGILQPFR